MTDTTTPAPKSAVTRAAEATVAGATNVWTFLTEAIKTQAVQNTLAIVVALVVGATGLAGYQKVTAPIVLPMATPDKVQSLPTPTACAQDFHDLNVEAAAIKGKLDEVLKRLPETKAPPPLKKTARVVR